MLAGDDFRFLEQPAHEVAPRLLGCELVRELNGQQLIGRIVETEAYDQTDPASHSYRGRTPRTEVMFGSPGFLYVYFTYGMHYCMNVVVGKPGHGAAVLIRAIEPIAGERLMRANRKDREELHITNGPAKLTQALAIDSTFNGHNLHLEPLQLIIKPALPASRIVQTSRVGITHAKDVPWRFYIKKNSFVSGAKKG
jgi:DNA-3-methyladenine glycosylase